MKPNSKHRVVVTGCGVVCALGNCVPEFAAALRAGRSGVRLVASDPTGPAAAAASPHLGPVSELPAPERALFDPVTRYAVHAATEALEQSGLLREREIRRAPEHWHNWEVFPRVSRAVEPPGRLEDDSPLRLLKDLCEASPHLLQELPELELLIK